MADLVESLITGALGFLTGTLGVYLANRYLEAKREFLSTKREQLREVFAPLEALMRMNKIEFERYFRRETRLEDKEFIEKNVWHPNHLEIKRILMEKSHLLPEIPEELLAVLTHINVWLTEFELTYVKKLQKPPVFAGTRGYPYPLEADDYVFRRARELRNLLNK